MLLSMEPGPKPVLPLIVLELVPSVSLLAQLQTPLLADLLAISAKSEKMGHMVLVLIHSSSDGR